MEHLWSRAVATSGNRWQMSQRRNRRNHAETVAAGCDQLPIGAHGKGALPPRTGGVASLAPQREVESGKPEGLQDSPPTLTPANSCGGVRYPTTPGTRRFETGLTADSVTRRLVLFVDPGRVNILECRGSQAAPETFRSSGLIRNSARRCSRCPFRCETSPTCAPCSGSGRVTSAVWSHARPMRSVPRCGHQRVMIPRRLPFDDR